MRRVGSSGFIAPHCWIDRYYDQYGSHVVQEAVACLVTQLDNEQVNFLRSCSPRRFDPWYRHFLFPGAFYVEDSGSLHC